MVMSYCVWAFSPTKITGTFPIDEKFQATFYGPSNWAMVANRAGKVRSFKRKVDAEYACVGLAYPGLTFKADREVQ